jgi:hypothetical protein
MQKECSQPPCFSDVLLRLDPVKSIFQLTVFAAKLVDLPLQFIAFFHRPRVHRLPVVGLLPQVDNFPSQFRDLLSQGADQCNEFRFVIGIKGWRRQFQQRGIHEGHALPNALLSSQINFPQTAPPKTGSAKV